MKVAVYSDLHGNLPAAKAIIDDIKSRGLKQICLGDMVGSGPKPAEVLALVKNSGAEILLGNHEIRTIYGPSVDHRENTEGRISHFDWVKDEIGKDGIQYLKTLQLSKRIGDVLFCHFPFFSESYDNYPFLQADMDDLEIIREWIKERPEKLVIAGHLHYPMEIDSFDNKKIILINSSGCVLGKASTSYMIVDTDNLETEEVFIEYDKDGFLKDILEKNYPYRIQILAEGNLSA